MSVKKMLNEWKRFLNEGESPEYHEFADDDYNDFPKSVDHNESVKEIQTFLEEIGADYGGHDAAVLLTLLQHPENEQTCKDLARFCRENPEDMSKICETGPEAAKSHDLPEDLYIDSRLLEMFIKVARSEPLNVSRIQFI